MDSQRTNTAEPTTEGKVLEVVESLDEGQARRAFSDAVMKHPRSTIERIEVADGSPIFRVTIIDSGWAIS